MLITMHLEGWSIRALSRHFNISRSMIRRVVRGHQAQRDKGHNILNGKKQVVRASKLDPFIPVIKRLLEKYPNISGQRVYEEIVHEGYTGRTTILKERLQVLRPTPRHKPVVRFETEPGKQGQMDWSPYTIRFTHSPKTTVVCFSYVLAYSRRHYIDFTHHRDFYTLIRRHQDAFKYFNGVPMQCLYDNEKTVALRWEAGHPVFNPAFIAFITHYRCKPIMCKPGNPQTKGKVESPFKYVEGNLLNGREFRDFQELRDMARWWLTNRSDTHIHDTTKRMPIELFMEEEQSALQALPAHHYDSSEVVLRVCRMDGFLEFETNLYSVPYEYIGDILPMKATESEIFIYSHDLNLIAQHERVDDGAGKTLENLNHRSSKKVRYGLEPVRELFLQLGDAAETFLEGLQERHPRNCGFHSRYILGLKEHYHCDDINKALKHATGYWAFDGKSIERILKATAKPRTLESIRNERARDELGKTLPQIKQRNLSEYSRLFLNKEDDEESERRDNHTDTTAPEDPESDDNTEHS